DRGTTTRLLARAAWLPDVEACLALQESLPPGWVLVSRDGRAVVGDVVVQLGIGDGASDVRADLEAARTELHAAEATLAAIAEASRAASEAVRARRAELEERRT